MRTFCPKLVRSLATRIFPNLRRTQLANLTLSVFGMIKGRSGNLSEVARNIPGDLKHKYKLKRLWRFVSNYRVKPERLQGLWIDWCLRKFTSGKRVLVAIDWTTLPGNIQLLMAATPFKGRAIPLLWYISLHSDIKDSQNRMEERLVTRLNNLITFSGNKLILVADRGFGRATFIQFLKKKNITFVVRVKSKVWITVGRKTSILLKRLYLIPEKKYWFKNITFREDGIVKKVSLAAVTVPPQNKYDEPDPWFLVTNLKYADTAIQTYKKRFHIEEWFKDFKHELGISDLKTKNLKRVRRIMLVSAFAYGVLALTGRVAERMEKVRDSVITGGRKVASIIWFAGKIIKHDLLKSQFWRKVWVAGVAS